jgi:hypothetical protein
MELVNQHLGLEAPEIDPDDPDAWTDAQVLLDELRKSGANVGSIMERLLLAGDEAKSDAEAIHLRIDKLRARMERRNRANERCRNAAMAIMANFPELFPPPPKSKALSAFRSATVDARVQRGKPGVQIIDPNKLMAEERFVKRSLNEAAVREAVLVDGEVIDGVEQKNGAPYLVVKAA